MVQHHEPVSRTRAAGLLTELLQYDFTGDFSAKLIQFERDCRRYEQASGDPFPDNIKIGTLVRKCPDENIRRHLVLNSSKYTAWKDVRDEIENLRRSMLAVNSQSGNGAMPMDVDAFWGGGEKFVEHQYNFFERWRLHCVKNL